MRALLLAVALLALAASARGGSHAAADERLVAWADETSKVARPASQAEFEVLVLNRADVLAQVRSEVVVPPRALRLLVPSPLDLHPGESGRLDLLAGTPRQRAASESDSFTLRFVSVDPIGTGAELGEAVLTFAVRTVGLDVPASAVHAALAAAGVALTLPRPSPSGPSARGRRRRRGG